MNITSGQTKRKSGTQSEAARPHLYDNNRFFCTFIHLLHMIFTSDFVDNESYLLYNNENTLRTVLARSLS